MTWKVGFKLWFYREDIPGVLGEGKISLLSSIKEYGSLQQACKHLQISYRKAWEDLKKLESNLNMVLLEKVRGGAEGGGMTLTPKAQKLVLIYEESHRELEKEAQKQLQNIKERILLL